MKSHELVPSAERIVKELSRRLNAGQIGLQDAEQRIVEFVNWVGDLMVQEVVEGVEEPTRANRIMVDGELAVFEQVRYLRFINRSGNTWCDRGGATSCSTSPVASRPWTRSWASRGAMTHFPGRCRSWTTTMRPAIWPSSVTCCRP